MCELRVPIANLAAVTHFYQITTFAQTIVVVIPIVVVVVDALCVSHSSFRMHRLILSPGTI